MRWIVGALGIVSACTMMVTASNDPPADDTTSTAPTTTGGGSSSTTDPSEPTTTTESSTGPSDPTIDPDTGNSDPSCVFGCWTDFGGWSCDPLQQDCARGEKCMPWASDGGPHWNDTICSPLDPDPAELGEPCTAFSGYTGGSDDCVLGAMCLFVDPETNEGLCVANCRAGIATPICEDPATGCSIAFSDLMVNCLPWCDPLLQDCAQGGCYPTADEAFVCGPTLGDGVQPGAPCEYHWDCAAGTICVESTCATICDLLDPGSCEGGICTPWFEPGRAPPDFGNVGVCTPEDG